MKRITPLLICLLFLTSCIKESQTQYSIDEDQVYLVITQNTTKEELAKIAVELKERKNIDLDYSNSLFQANGKISELKLTVDCNDGFKGSTNCTSGALKLRNMGFLRDYQSESETTFHIGPM